ncbi:ABC transporter permease [Pollutimonas bauzanensis]|uniref:Peptide/nickel transport system permease protein n=1 Tax=Pollutimonas bauzanensis TaxID=658167 RepID=A0A1M5SME4_9BURK|nr:ABC transporter permease [Pollutimonas bauzanensis]SHH39620.1 peptide/nickel transport system permease protein [Pollutimonas bauzanensis]
MARYLLHRLLALIPVLGVVAVVVFLIVHLTPGDPATVILGDEATPQQRLALIAQLGLDKPLAEQFFTWFANVARGNLGVSIFMRDDVLNVFLDHLGPTVSLAVFAQLLAAVPGVWLGIVAARRRGSLVDQSVMGFSMLGISVPSFLLGLFLILTFSVWLRWLPVAGYRPLSEGLWTHLRYLVLPAVALGAIQAALLARMTRSAMLDILNDSYIKTARAKGLAERLVIYRHALRNALIPILTVFGETFGALITGAAVVETVFNIPGVGQLIVNSIARRDFPVIQGAILLITVTYVLLNLFIDMLYGLVDPRVKLGRS